MAPTRCQLRLFLILRLFLHFLIQKLELFKMVRTFGLKLVSATYIRDVTRSLATQLFTGRLFAFQSHLPNSLSYFPHLFKTLLV